MIHSTPLPQILILLAAAVVVVAGFRHFRLSPVLGYLAAGAAIGPYGLGFIHEVEETAVIAELGVVFLLFVIGAELSFDRIKGMGSQVFGLGGAQILITGSLIGIAAVQFGFSTEVALIVGMGLALSSTALVMQIIEENRKQNTQLGRLSLSVLIMQDLAVVPLLVLVPLLATQDAKLGEALIRAGINALIAFAVVLVGGRLFLRPLFRSIAMLEIAELFSAFTLLVVLGISWAFHSAGLSMPLGAFVAGLLLAETEYKHQVEADIMPYKGLLLGLFFMVVGMSLDFALILERFETVFGLVVALMLGKATVLFLLCRMMKLHTGNALRASLLLSQGGEFAFIVFGICANVGLLEQRVSQLLMVVVTVSMALTPFAYILGRKLSKRLRPPATPGAEGSSTMEPLDLEQHVLILGYGRVGQTIGKLLAAEGITYIALDSNADIVTQARERGRPVYFGDATRREVLQAMAIHQARAAVITTNDFYAANKAVVAIRNLVPNVPIIARGHDLHHLQKLELAGADIAIAEKFEASLQLGGAVMRRMGVPDHEIGRIIEIFRERDYALTRTGEVRAADE